MKDWYKVRDQLKAEASELAAKLKAEDRKMNDDEAARVSQLKAELDEANAKTELIDAATASVRELVEAKGADNERGLKGRAQGNTGLGSALVGSDGYKAWRGKGQTNGPVDIATGRALDFAQAKAAVTIGDNAPKERLPMVDLTVPAQLGLLDVITTGEANGPFEYMRLLTNSQAADIAPEDTTKPESAFTYDVADAKSYTYADSYPVTKQFLADAGAAASYLDSRLALNITERIEDVLINGDTANGEPDGVLNVSGTVGVSFATDMVTTLRKAITALKGTRITGVLLNPADDEALDLLKDGNQRYYGAGPFGAGPTTVWGRPRIITEKVPAGTAIMGDLSTIALFDHEGLSVHAYDQHADFAAKNKVLVLAELRAIQALFEPGRLAVVELTSGA